MVTFSYNVIFYSTLLLLSGFSTLPTCLAAGPKKVAATARREDIPYIQCQVCEMLAQQIHEQVEAKRSAVGSTKKVTELEVIEIAENVCNLKKQEADWILRVDIVENGGSLKIVDRGTEGQCNSKCKTVEQACQKVMGYLDTDVAEYVYTKNPSVQSLVKYLCHDLSGACSAIPPPLPKNRIPGEDFIPKSSKEAEMDRLMKSMEGMPGAPNMKMYSRDDLLNMKGMGMGGQEGGEDSDSDDDDDGDNFPSKLGNAMRAKDSSKSDLKNQIIKGIKETGSALKKHAKKGSDYLKKLWKGDKKKKKKKVKPSKSDKTEL